MRWFPTWAAWRASRVAEPRRLVIHAGTHKTGTTAVQEAMGARGGAMRAAGWLYPRSGRYAPYAAHHELATELCGRTGFAGTPLADVKAEIAGWDGDVIISSEILAGLLPGAAPMQDFLVWAREAGFAPCFVSVLREHAAYAVSLYVTLMQQFHPANLSDFLGEAAASGSLMVGAKRYPFRYDAMLNNLASYGVPVRAVGYAEIAGRLGGGFTALAGLPAGLLADPFPSANVRADPIATVCAFHTVLAGAAPSPEQVARYATAARMASPDGLSLAEAQGFAAAFAASDAALARDWGVVLPPPSPRPGGSLIPLLHRSFILGPPGPDLPAARRAEMAALRAQAAAGSQAILEMAIIRASTSWRVTAPLRALGRLLGR